MTTTPDSNVGVARRRGAANARRARPSSLARLLLRTGVKLLLSFAAASSMSACIIPVGPEFQDPPGAPNASPEIINANPTWGAEVSATALMGQPFQITVTDPNAETLYIRFIVDGVIVEPPQRMVSPSELPKQLTKVVACNTDIHTPQSRHPVTAVVADQDFVSGDPDLRKSPGLTSIITWTLNLTCPVSP
jgi:hypothetical protein